MKNDKQLVNDATTREALERKRLAIEGQAVAWIPPDPHIDREKNAGLGFPRHPFRANSL
jgi:hypothetical protein